MTRTTRLRAFAKVNLGLRILYKRPDNYHELRTVFQTISLADKIEVRFDRTRKTTVKIEGTPDIADNLVSKASRLVLESLKIHAHVSFTLNKTIPMGAGLGGGSSDAAAVLLALPSLAGKELSLTTLTTLATQLGSDVPFFLYGGTALGFGRGEELYPLPDHQPGHGLLIAPGIHSSTAEAYGDLSATLTSPGPQNKLARFQKELWQGGWAMDANDFEPVVFARHPELKRIKTRLLRLGAKTAAMTGSGSSLFGFFEDKALRDRALRQFENERVFPISFLSRARYQAAFRTSLSSALPIQQNIWPPRSAHA
jgi:4-diphosphocytidyl-2-C-methyl-D-erythritol kinase